MAQDQNNSTRTFDKSLNEDVKDFHLPSNEWTQARNAINNSKTGDLGRLGNEPANTACLTSDLQYTIIGFIHIIEDKWAVFSTDNVNSEIGLFTESKCSLNEEAYIPVVNAACLNFNTANLIIGVSRATSTCTYNLYWDDGINPTRVLEIDVDNPARNEYTDPNSTIPWIQAPAPGPIGGPPCNDTINTAALDCDKIRLAPLMMPICPRVENGISGGNVLNGSYMIAMAYAVKGQKISDWYISNIQPIWSHDNSSGSLDVYIDSIDLDYDEIQVVVISVVNQQAVARLAGIYSTRQTRIGFDTVFNTWPSVPIEQIPIMTPIPNKTDATYSVGEYMIRVGPTSKEDFNYQPLANQIVTKWQSVEYPADYYVRSNNNVGYMRDEVYSFFIQWIYDTGDRSAAYHIPGRPAFNLLPINGSIPAGIDILGDQGSVGVNPNAILGQSEVWEIYNTGAQTATPGTVLPDGGTLIAEGLMGYWESSENYPDGKPEIWNSVNNPLGGGFITATTPYNTIAGGIWGGSTPITELDLCGKKIRHHKIPEDNLSGFTNRYNAGTGDKIRVMGVKFENIKAPLMNDGVTRIPGIVGYRILRGTRNGNRSIIAKGIINNMHEYDMPGDNTKIGLYPNYPYNDLGYPNNPATGQPRVDPFLSTQQTATASSINPASPGIVVTAGQTTYNSPMPGGFATSPGQFPRFSQNYLTFHSPDTNFNNPFLSSKEFRIYQNVHGDVVGKYELSEEHPREKLITDYVFLIAAICGIGVSALNANGPRTVKKTIATYPGFSHRDSFVKKTTYSLTSVGTQTLQPLGINTLTTSVLPTPTTPLSAATQTSTQQITPGVTNVNQPTNGSTDNSQSYKADDPSGPDPDFYTEIIDEATGSIITSNIAEAKADYDEDYYGTNPLNQTKTPFLSAVVASFNFDGALDTAQDTSNDAVDNTGGAYASSTTSVDQTDGNNQRIPKPLRILQTLPSFLNYFTEGTDSFIRLIKAFLSYKDYAVRYHSHGFYNKTAIRPTQQFRTELWNHQYIDPELVDFDPSHRINNLYRTRTVAMHTKALLDKPTINDITRFSSDQLTTVGSNPFWPTNPITLVPIKSIENLVAKNITGAMTTFGTGIGQVCSSHYGALKLRIENQYSQLNRIIQIPTAHCYTIFTVVNGQVTAGAETNVIFGGDTYVNRYTEKNTFFYFYDWLYGQPDGAQFDYTKHNMIAYPKYWANFNQFQTNDFTTTLIETLVIPSNWANLFTSSNNLITPRDYYALDGSIEGNWASNIASNFRFDKRGWFYLFNSGVRDFFVESEINLAFRDYGELARQKFYNPYLGGNTKDLFNTDIIKAGNYYKYDISLSTSKLPFNYTSWASTQEPSYNPYDAETCFVYQPTRVIYSLPAQYEGLRDGWRVFLPNNYYDFDNIVTCIKPVNKSGAMIFFDAASPVQFQGTDQLQTDLGTKLTIGDGGLFSQPMQQIINVDRSHEYGSCQNRLSVINTPAGLYWMSQNQGKVFSLSGGLKEISNINMKWWFAQYLPYQLTEIFPDFSLIDNPVIGIGCQSMYDNENGILYFSKRDYILKSPFTADDFEYISGTNQFTYLPTQTIVELGNPLYFEDASWTVSYDPKTDGWISYHDWHPTLNLPGKNTFMTVSPFNKKTIWVHNERCDLYCNYYGFNFPFEVEFTVNTGGTVNSIRSIEYIMEAYKYAANCYDRFHVLDYNFDEAVLYNTEQVSGLLRLNIKPKDNPNTILQYPIINPTNIDILFSKEENKYRFNQFWDITDDRGEFNLSAQRPIWNTGANGYARVLNPANLNYNKPELQRKKFRHYTTSVLLRKRVIVGENMNYKMLVMIADAKNLYSPR